MPRSSRRLLSVMPECVQAFVAPFQHLVEAPADLFGSTWMSTRCGYCRSASAARLVVVARHRVTPARGRTEEKPAGAGRGSVWSGYSRR
jgi:hypothetical protein